MLNWADHVASLFEDERLQFSWGRGLSISEARGMLRFIQDIDWVVAKSTAFLSNRGCTVSL